MTCSSSACPTSRSNPARNRSPIADLIKKVERGIYIVGNGSFSIDQQRYNFQFGGQMFFEIKDGEIDGMLRDVAYQSNTQEFWNSCVAVCDENDYTLGGSFFDGKGQPGQVSAVSHGSATARFNKVNVINTARKICLRTLLCRHLLIPRLQFYLLDLMAQLSEIGCPSHPQKSARLLQGRRMRSHAHRRPGR